MIKKTAKYSIIFVIFFFPEIARLEEYYHSYSQIDRELHEIAIRHSNVSKISSIGTTWEGRPIWILLVSDDTGPKPEILIIGGHHAREWLTVEIPFLLAEYLTEYYGYDDRVTRIVRSMGILIIPVLNPDGYEYSRTIDRNWRKNRRDNRDGTYGVDLNRNYSFEWGGKASSILTSSDIYSGPAPFSELETRAVRDIIVERNIIAVIDFHCYGQLIKYPEENIVMEEISFEMTDLIMNIHGKTYQATSYNIPLFGGSCTDWINGNGYGDAYLVELRPNGNTSEYPWLADYSAFEAPESEILPVWEENRAALLHIIERYAEINPESQYADNTTPETGGSGCFITSVSKNPFFVSEIRK